ncbi:MAG TPA: hypothetical protein VFS00_26085 [Polyangiaceae bacterium]|nr:hypothetical protein [Polyangiaceae bacterium]
MLLLRLLQLAWPSPEVGMGFALGLAFTTMTFRESLPAPKRRKV